MKAKIYSLGEEIANSVTHGIGAALAIAALTLLVSFGAVRGNAWHVVGFSIYGATLILLYLSSTLYHSFSNPRVKRVFRVLDHASIFLLIAGTYTPFLLVNLRGPLGWWLFGVIWGLTLLGIGGRLFWGERFRRASIFLYLAMGWICIFTFEEMTQSINGAGILWLVIGGVTYTLGVPFYIWHRLPYNHAIWHVFVLGGSISHFFAVYYSVLPPAA